MGDGLSESSDVAEVWKAGWLGVRGRAQSAFELSRSLFRLALGLISILLFLFAFFSYARFFVGFVSLIVSDLARQRYICTGIIKIART